MPTHNNDQELIIDVELLKKDVSILSQLCTKMDLIIEKLLENDEKIISQWVSELKKQEKETNDKIDALRIEKTKQTEETEEKFLDEVKDLKKEISQINGKLEQIFRWKWIAMGGIIASILLLKGLPIDIILKMLH